MTDDSKPGQKRPDEPDPLSATAMFLRALDQQSETKPSEAAAAKPEPAGTANLAGRGEASSFDSHPVRGKGEFTEIFGKPGSAQFSPEPSISAQPAAANRPPSEPVRPVKEPGVTQTLGEFTQIFVKDAASSAKPVARNIDERQEAGPAQAARPKGFSSPGASDAASAETGFTQFFKPGAKGAGGPAQSGQPAVSALRPEAPRGEMQFGRPGDTPNAANADPSITSLIESLSSPSAAASGPRAHEPAPYRADPAASFQPAAKPATPSDLDSGGVTRFIQRLSDPPPAQQAPPAPLPVRDSNPDPGEFTRIISAPMRAVGSTPDPVPPPAQPPSPGIAFARPVAPPLPANPIQVAMPVAHASAPPAMAAPPVPSPRLPVAPAPPKGKLEALVPMLLVVNTFLLVVILVVMIFLIKGK